MKKKLSIKCYVNHPRYGDKPIPSSQNIPSDAIAWAHWKYASVKFFPETAIRANTEKQNHGEYPRSIYVDIEEQCEVCGRPFIFFALEQQYWFEVLGFWVDAHCTRCIDCRKKDQDVRHMQQRYQALISKPNRSEKETSVLKNIALELYQIGCIRDKAKIDAIR
jgi:hypothetical protein